MATNHNGRKFAACLLILYVLNLHSCTGGISGTGDGGPIIVVTNNVDLDSHISTADGTTAGDIAQPDSVESLAPPMQITFAFPAALAGQQSQTNSTQSVYLALRKQFTAAANILLDAQVWVDLVSTQIASAETLCGIDSECIATQLTRSYLYSGDIFERDLNRRLSSLDQQLPEAERLTLENTLRDRLNISLNTTLELTVDNYRLASDASETQHLRISTAGATFDLQWLPPGNVTATRYIDDNTTLHSMHFGNDTRFTLRLHDRQAALLLAAAFEPVDDGLLYEADIHQAATASQSYIRGFSNQQGGTLISVDPRIDSTTPLLRERYLSNGQLVSQQLCTDCNTANNWQEQLQNASDSASQYASFTSDFGGFEQTIADDVTIVNLDDSVAEWLITNGEARNSPSDNAACSGQRVGAAVRNLCWAISIDPSQVRVFQEQLQPSGELSYRLLD